MDDRSFRAAMARAIIATVAASSTTTITHGLRRERPVPDRLAEYLLPSATDFPTLRAIVLENSPSPFNPLGTRSAGEGGIDALPRDLPLSPPYTWSLVQCGPLMRK